MTTWAGLHVLCGLELVESYSDGQGGMCRCESCLSASHLQSGSQGTPSPPLPVPLVLPANPFRSRFSAFQNGNSPKSSPVNGSHNQSGSFITQQHSSEWEGGSFHCWPSSNHGPLFSFAVSPTSGSSPGLNTSIFNQSNSPLSPVYGDTGGSPISPHRRVNPRFM